MPKDSSHSVKALWIMIRSRELVSHRVLEAREAHRSPGLRVPKRPLRGHKIDHQKKVPRVEAVRRGFRLSQRHELFPAEPDGVEGTRRGRLSSCLERPPHSASYVRVHPHGLHPASQHTAAPSVRFGEVNDASHGGFCAAEKSSEIVPGGPPKYRLNL